MDMYVWKYEFVYYWMVNLRGCHLHRENIYKWHPELSVHLNTISRRRDFGRPWDKVSYAISKRILKYLRYILRQNSEASLINTETQETSCGTKSYCGLLETFAINNATVYSPLICVRGYNLPDKHTRKKLRVNIILIKLYCLYKAEVTINMGAL